MDFDEKERDRFVIGVLLHFSFSIQAHLCAPRFFFFQFLLSIESVNSTKRRRGEESIVGIVEKHRLLRMFCHSAIELRGVFSEIKLPVRVKKVKKEMPSNRFFLLLTEINANMTATCAK